MLKRWRPPPDPQRVRPGRRRRKRGQVGTAPSDRPSRLRLVCDTYELDAQDRPEVLHTLDVSTAQGGELVRRRAEAGAPGFVQMWADIGGMDRFERRRRRWETARSSFDAAVQ